MHINSLPDHFHRRHFLATGAMSLGPAALAWLLNEETLRAAPARPELEPKRYDLTPKQPPMPPRAGDDLAVHAGGPQPYRPVRPQAALDPP